MNEKEALTGLKNLSQIFKLCSENDVKLKDFNIMNPKAYKEAIETVLNHITKQEKMIELMSRFIDTELSSEHLSKVLKIDVKPLETYRENIKQYFEKKSEEETNNE